MDIKHTSAYIENTFDNNTINNDIPKHLIVKTESLSTDPITGEKKNNSTDNELLNKDNAEVKRSERKKIIKINRGDSILNERIYENYTRVDKAKTDEDILLIKECLNKHFAFSNFSTNETNTIIEQMFYTEINQNDFLFRQGDTQATSYFIIAHGEIDIIINNQLKKILKKGEGFGELALLYNAPRSASAHARIKCGLWTIDRATFRKTIEDVVQREYDENKKFIEKTLFFKTMTSEQKDAVAGALLTVNYPKGKVIVYEGDPASSFYVIKEGRVSVTKGDTEIRTMGPGESFGEQALYYNATRLCTVKAIEDVKCLSLGRDKLTRILGDQLQTIAFKNIQKWAFEKDQFLSKLTQIQREKAIEKMDYCDKRAGDVIFPINSRYSDKIIVVLEGSIKAEKSNVILAKKGDVWETRFQLQNNMDIICEDPIIMNEDGVLAQLTSEDFIACIGGNLEFIIKKNEFSHENKMTKMISEAKKMGANLKFEDLIFCAKLGAGMFGSVYLVKAKGVDMVFALKCISKSEIVEKGVEYHLLQEKAVMEAINFPFLMQFIRSFHDQNYVYFLIEYIKGMELFDAIRDMPLLTTYPSQFYIGQLLLGLEYLHSKGIIYRDLKPENIMVDQHGYLRMIDMGTAKILKNKAGSFTRTFTIIGTPHYMAPEIITGKGYTTHVDLWSLGVILYEFMCGRLPFAEDADDPYEIYEEIMTKPLIYPSFLKDKKARRLIDQLVNKIPELRLGSSYGALKANGWFDQFDWDQLMDRQLKPPYIPPSNRMISDNTIKQMENRGERIINIINAEIMRHPEKQYTKEMRLHTRNPLWDQVF